MYRAVALMRRWVSGKCLSFRTGTGPALAALLFVSLVGSGCSSLSAMRQTPVANLDPSRAELPVDYDVLLAEMALGDGDFVAAKYALERATSKDPDSAYLEMRISRIDAELEDLPSAIAHASRALEIEPDNAEARLLVGGLYRIARDVDAAEKALLGADGKPVSDDAALLLYQVYFESDRLNEALEITEYLVANRPEILGGFMALATIYERLGKPEHAERVLREALEEHPDRFVLYSRLARLKRSSGDRLGEVEVYREGLARRPTHYGSLLSLAEALVNANDLDGAIATYEKIMSHYPEDVKTVRRLASIEFATGNHERAQTLLEQALFDFPGRFEFAYSLGQVRRSMQSLDSALEAFEMVPLGDASYVEARAQIISIFEERADFASALTEINALRELAPSRSFEYHAAGLFLRNGDYDTGKAILDGLLAESPEDEEVLYQLGVFYGLAEDTSRAIATMKHVLEINPNNAHALNYVGYSWAERGENLEEAEQMIIRALSQRPNDGFITDSLGWVYYMRGRTLIRNNSVDKGKEFLLRARDQLTLAAELTGGDPVVSEHLGDVYRILDEKQRAFEFYREAVEMDHREEEQPDLLEKLDVLRRELGEL
ncbi:MAG: tetratricopeptide (TPR) repeat protein [Myxococcota bacterium]|jgi:tetratricopeptide (TPR) repeat protein